MKTISRDIITIQDIDNLVQEKNIQDSSNLLMQFFSGTSDENLIKKFQNYFQEKFPLATLLGSTSDGILNESEVHIENIHLIIFTQFEHTTLQSLILDHDDSFHDHFKSGYMLASHLIKKDTKALITFSDGINTNGEEYLKGINSFNKSTIISGGMAGDNGALSKTYIFDKKYITSNGAIAVALNSDILEVTTNFNFDWMPIGKKLSVTKAKGNRVYEIDGMTTVELYTKYLGEEVASLLPQTGIEFPLIVQRDGIDTARAVILRHDDNSLSFAGNVLEGELIRFGIGNVDKILQGGDTNLREIVKNAKKQIDSFFIYSCMARRRFMRSYTRKELLPFANIATTAGFFTYGEFFHSHEKAQLLNESMTVLALSENSKPNKQTLEQAVSIQSHFTANPVHTIAHLTNAISYELEELNTTLESRIHRNTDQIYKQAYFDKLTGLPNRLNLIKTLKNHPKHNILLINIDEFNLLNDFYGHETGDMVLKDIASFLELFSSAEHALAYKLPADEFAIILDHIYTDSSLEALIKRLIKELNGHYITYSNYQIKVDVTVSSAAILDDGIGLANASMALKLAKKKNISYLIFDESFMLLESHETNLTTAIIIRQAIKDDQIIPYFQPIFNAKTNTIEKYECLVRLQLPSGDILSPYSFLDISKKIKLYPSITKIMIDKTFSYFSDTSHKFSINLSFEDILDPLIQEYLFKKIKEFDIAQQLTIEILENQELEKEDQVREFINKLYSLGSNIAIDDFGSGYANFQHITKIKADYLKIDGSLIKNIDTDHNSRLIVETIVVFAKKLGMKTVAEFVHSKEVYDTVKKLDIDLLQGYYLDMPLSEI